MIDEQELRKMLGDLESDRVERTTSTDNTDKFCEAICAFANDMPANPWFNLSTNTAGSNGLWTVLDPTATNVTRYYRVSTP